MAQDAPAEGLPSRKCRQLAELRERLDPYHRIVAPVAATPQLPEIQAADEKRPVEPHRELLQAGENGNPAYQLRRCLQDAQLRIRLQHLRHLHDVRPVHQAVRIKHQHPLVSASPGAHEITDVPRLAVLVCLAAPVIDLPEGLQPQAKVCPCHLLQHPKIEIPGVAQDEKVEGIEMTGRLDGSEDRLDPGAELRTVLIVDRHHHRMALPKHRSRPVRKLGDPHRTPAPAQDVERPEQRMEGTQHQQSVEYRENDEQRDVRPVNPRPPEKVGKPKHRRQVHDDDRGEENKTPPLCRRSPVKGLHCAFPIMFRCVHQSKNMNQITAARSPSSATAVMIRTMGRLSIVSHHCAAPLPIALSSNGFGTIVSSANCGPAAR